MKRTVRYGAIAGVIVVVTAASVLSQTRTRVNASRRGGQQQQGLAFSFDPQARPDETPAEMQARHQRNFQERMAQMQRQAEEMQRRAEESKNNAIRQAVGATEQQWRQIKPKLDLVEKLKAEANVAVEPGAFGGAPGFQGNMSTFGGGFAGATAGGGGGFGTMGGSRQPGQTWSQYKSWSWPSAASSTSGEMTDGQAICAQLQDLLSAPGAPAEEVSQKVAALRRIRQNARDRLARVRQELRQTLTPQQEIPLIAMGYLE
jgi:hypothetical protein